MKCPRCGYESGTDPLCGKCGFNHTEGKDKIEVEYKDFKTSELLEIRQKRQSLSSGDTKTDGEHRRNESRPAETREKRFPVATIIALLVALTALAYFLFRHILFK